MQLLLNVVTIRSGPSPFGISVPARSLLVARVATCAVCCPIQWRGNGTYLEEIALGGKGDAQGARESLLRLVEVSKSVAAGPDLDLHRYRPAGTRGAGVEQVYR